MLFLRVGVEESVLSLSPNVEGEVHLQPPPTRKEHLADLLMRWAWVLYPEFICYILEIDENEYFL